MDRIASHAAAVFALYSFPSAATPDQLHFIYTLHFSNCLAWLSLSSFTSGSEYVMEILNKQHDIIYLNKNNIK